MNAVRLALAAVAGALATLAGCALFSPPPPEMATATLDRLPDALPQRARRPVTLLVLAPVAAPAYDTRQMAYSRGAHEIAYFRDHQWAQTPPQMLQPLLVKSLEATGHFGAVLTPPYTGRYAYALRTELVELLQDFGSDPPVLRLALRLRLNDEAANRVVATKEIALREPLPQRTAEAGVAAANEATAKALQQAAAFVLENAD